MKNVFIGLIILFNTSIFAESGTLLNQAGSEIEFSGNNQLQKQLVLDDPFLIQLYSSWKAMGAINAETNQWIELVINKNYSEALRLLPKISDQKITSIKAPTELYLLYKTNNYTTFFSRWIDLASSTRLLQSEMGIAIDQIIGSSATNIILSHGFYLSKDKNEKLKIIETIPSKINYSLQGLKALRSGEAAVAWISKLDENDPLRLPLAKTALLFYAKNNKLGASGKILKTIIEPIIRKSNDQEELALYFMTLGRLLYRAEALSESQKYFDLIPESSSYFLKARAESLWSAFRLKNYSKAKGELATLELKMFNDKFYPEAYLISAMANVMLCQFTDSRAAFNRFIEVNRTWAREIDAEINNPNAKPVNTNFFISNLEKSKISLAAEKEAISKNNFSETYLRPIDSELDLINKSIHEEATLQWKNRKALLETALYKMKFVKIELISRMRSTEMNMKIANSDEVTEQNAAPRRENQLSFPKDGALWGDELFHMSASIKNKCIRNDSNGVSK